MDLRFNTASGMDCMQYGLFTEKEFLAKEFQYRKRYGLHAIAEEPISRGNGPHLFQYRKRYGLHAIELAIIADDGFIVSIPQAVWIACNTVPHSPWDS